ncbi:transposase family protein [Streptosporangium sp. NPDC087985]|uniref:transposase family protein n=1 Tax=Streptosporangium sp. NPDC087985 TaxID=3366196 RepID=UPI0037F39E82
MCDAGLGALADLGFVGLDDDGDNPVVITGRKATRGKPFTVAQKQVNQLIASERAPVERGFADLKNWRILTKLRLDAARATALLRPAGADHQRDHPVTDDHSS